MGNFHEPDHFMVLMVNNCILTPPVSTVSVGSRVKEIPMDKHMEFKDEVLWRSQDNPV